MPSRARSTTVTISGDEETAAASNSQSNHADPRVAVLERRIKQLEEERDKLKRDIKYFQDESSGSTLFDSSFFLNERMFSAEQERDKLKIQLKQVTEERDDLVENLTNHRQSRRQVDNSWREEKKRADTLEKELQFYQSQSATAIKGRDQLEYDIEELRKSALKMERRAQEAESQVETATTMQSELEQQLEEANARIKVLAEKAKECESIPGLLRHLEESSKQIEKLKAAQEEVQRSLRAAESDSQEARDLAKTAGHKRVAAEKELRDSQSRYCEEKEKDATEIRALKSRVAELESEKEKLTKTAEEAEGNLAASQAETETAVSDLESQIDKLKATHSEKLASIEATHSSEVESLQEDLRTAKAEFERVKSDFEQGVAVLRASNQERISQRALEDVRVQREEIEDLNTRLKQATQEKVAALLQVAQLNEARRTGNMPSQPAAAQARGWRDRIFGQGSAEPGGAEPEGSDQQHAAPEVAELRPEAEES